MLRNFDEPIRDLEGRPLATTGQVLADARPGPDGIDPRPMTVASVATNALMVDSRGEPSGDEKAARYRLAIRLVAGGEKEINAEDLAKIKACVGSVYSPLIVGQVWTWADADYAPVAAGKPKTNGR